MNSLDLFSGIGGISLALAPYARPVAYCEIEKYCQSVLLQRMQEGVLPVAPIWGDVQTLPLEQLPQVDLITAGFPCQDISVAGPGKGLEGKRSGLFFEIARIARELLPSFIFLENVPAVTLRGGPTVIGTLADLGYDCRWCVVSAEQFGALHQRKRWFCLCYAKSKPGEQTNSQTVSVSSEKEAWRNNSRDHWPFKSRDDWQEIVGRVGRVIDGVSPELDFNKNRLHALGNSVVPIQARKAFEILIGRYKGD